MFCNVAIFFFITDLFCQIHHKHKSTVRWNTNKALTTTLDYRFTCATCSLTNRKGGNFVCLKTIVSLFSPECSKCCSSFMLLNKWGSKKYNYYYCSVGISLCYRPSMRADVCLNSVCSLLGKVTPLSVCVCVCLCTLFVCRTKSFYPSACLWNEFVMQAWCFNYSCDVLILVTFRFMFMFMWTWWTWWTQYLDVYTLPLSFTEYCTRFLCTCSLYASLKELY